MSGALAIGTATTSAAASARPNVKADKTIECATMPSSKEPFYNGTSASYIYDRRFGPGPPIPGLFKPVPGIPPDTYTPQGCPS